MIMNNSTDSSDHTERTDTAIVLHELGWDEEQEDSGIYPLLFHGS